MWKFKDILTQLKRSPPSEQAGRILHNDTNAFNVLPKRRSRVDLHFFTRVYALTTPSFNRGKASEKSIF
ncbi:hypothetical protein [Nostoc sp.]